jgi:hypothetical protein
MSINMDYSNVITSHSLANRIEPSILRLSIAVSILTSIILVTLVLVIGLIA